MPVRQQRTKDEGQFANNMRLTVARRLPGGEREILLDVGPKELEKVLAESDSVAIIEWGRYAQSGWAFGSEEQLRVVALVRSNSDKIVEREELDAPKRTKKKK
jgi:hypothetical protein